ncbi:MAG: hypothetical protein Q9174_005640 [Haloplaca sp. 1 TL-2023]
MSSSFTQTASQSFPARSSFSKESSESSNGAANLSQNAMYSFDGAQSTGSTPTPTPPASRSQLQTASFHTNSYPQPNGVPIQQAPQKRHNELNGYIPQLQYPQGHEPPIVYQASLFPNPY